MDGGGQVVQLSNQNKKFAHCESKDSIQVNSNERVHVAKHARSVFEMLDSH